MELALTYHLLGDSLSPNGKKMTTPTTQADKTKKKLNNDLSDYDTGGLITQVKVYPHKTKLSV